MASAVKATVRVAMHFDVVVEVWETDSMQKAARSAEEVACRHLREAVNNLPETTVIKGDISTSTQSLVVPL